MASGGNKTDIYDMYVERLHEAAAGGDVDMVHAALKGQNVQHSYNGWSSKPYT